MTNLSSDAQEKVQRLQLFEQNLQMLNSQKQQFQAQLFEIESALRELSSASVAYKMVGSIMVNSSKESLEKELLGQRELVELRLQTLEKQEKQFREKAKSIQEEVLSSIKEAG